MQVGGFYEIYNNLNNEGADLYKLSDELNYRVAKKDKIQMMGCPEYIIEELTEKLINNNYTIVRIDQEFNFRKKVTRKITGIISPSTYVQKTETENKYLCCIILDIIKLKNTHLLCTGMTSYDLTTGQGYVYETVSKIDDKMYCLDDTIRFLENYPPSEIIFDISNSLLSYLTDHNKYENMTIDDIKLYLGINNINMYKTNNMDILIKTQYQTEFLNKVFKHYSKINIIDDIGLSYYNNAVLSLVILLDFAKNHQSLLLTKLKKPKLFINNMFLGNKALDQLDILNKPKCLFNIINYTKTPMGKRFLKDTISNPLYQTDIINERYELIDMAIKNNLHKNNYFENIYDLTKLSRKMNLNNIHPYELYYIYISLITINKNLLELKQYPNFSKLFNIKNKKKIKQIVIFIKNNFDINYMSNVNFINYKEESKCYIFNDELKKLAVNIENGNNFLSLLVTKLESFIKEDNTFISKDPIQLKYNKGIHYLLTSKKRGELLKNTFESFSINNKVINKDNIIFDNKTKTSTKIIAKLTDDEYLELSKYLISLLNEDEKEFIQLKCNDKEGHYLTITKNRSKILIKNLKKKKIINVGNKSINVDNLEFKDLASGNTVKIHCPEIKNMSFEVSKLKEILAKKSKEYFYELIKEIDVDYIYYISNKIGYLDFIMSGAIIANKFGYCKPNIIENENSYFDAVELRHPIVERINTDIEYKPHNISIGKEKYGILLYGINSSGKSTLMKSIGINIILAQIGYYVAAKQFTYYPYKSIMTRIVGNDNIFKGMSSFMVEMVELMAILKRNNNNTLVLGDEICRGTEEKSANIIVSYMLEKLEQNKSSFITATHLHQIGEMKSVKELSKVKSMHIKISYDDKEDKLIYNRELCDGQGDKYYGVMVAKYLMKDNEFNIRTKELENEYENIDIKFSKYNTKSIIQNCEICKETQLLETHHIHFQKDCINGKVIDKPHINMNSNCNIVTLCRQCHDEVDRENIIVKGWLETNNGRELEYEIKNNKPNYDINIVINIKKLTDDLKRAKKILKTKHNIKISRKEIKQIWSN